MMPRRCFSAPRSRGLTLLYARRSRGSPADNLAFACVLASLYWVTQAGAVLLPDTAPVDPEFVTPDTARLSGVPGVQPAIDAAVLAVIGAAYWLGMWGLRTPSTAASRAANPSPGGATP